MNEETRSKQDVEQRGERLPKTAIVSVKLAEGVTHTHAGKEHTGGATIEMDPGHAEWMVANKRGTIVS